MLAISRSSARLTTVAATFKSSSSRWRAVRSSSTKTWRVTSSRSVWSSSWLRRFSSPYTVTVMRLMVGSLVAETVRLSMLKPRRVNRLDTRARTPVWLSTSRLTTLRCSVRCSVLSMLVPPYSMMMLLMSPPPGIMGRTFSSLPIMHSIQVGPSWFCSASAKAAWNWARFSQW